MIRLGMLVQGGATLAILLGCYTVSLKASSERKAVDDLRGKIAGDLKGINVLEAELRTRSRMPELQRWNDEVFGLQPVSALQFVRDPVQLAAFETRDAAPPPLHYAIAPAPVAPAPAPVRTAAYRPDAAPAQAAALTRVDDLVAAATAAPATLTRVALR